MPKHKHPGSLCDGIPGGNSFPFLGSTAGSCLPGWQGRGNAGSHTVFTPPFPLPYQWLVPGKGRCYWPHTRVSFVP